jgi:hypothetical protein
MSSNLRQYKTLQAFKAAEPEISRRVFMLATKVACGFTDDTGRKIPTWPKAVVWFCKAMQPTHNGSQYGCDALMVEHALLEYIRKPLVLQSHKAPWGLMNVIATSISTKRRIDEVRWIEIKQDDRETAPGSLQRLGELIPKNILPKGTD